MVFILFAEGIKSLDYFMSKIGLSSSNERSINTDGVKNSGPSDTTERRRKLIMMLSARAITLLLALAIKKMSPIWPKILPPVLLIALSSLQLVASQNQ